MRRETIRRQHGRDEKKTNTSAVYRDTHTDTYVCTFPRERGKGNKESRPAWAFQVSVSAVRWRSERGTKRRRENESRCGASTHGRVSRLCVRVCVSMCAPFRGGLKRTCVCTEADGRDIAEHVSPRMSMSFISRAVPPTPPHPRSPVSRGHRYLPMPPQLRQELDPLPTSTTPVSHMRAYKAKQSDESPPRDDTGGHLCI